MQKFSKIQSFYSQKQTNFSKSTSKIDDDNLFSEDIEDNYSDNDYLENQNEKELTLEKENDDSINNANNQPISLKARQMLKCAEAHRNAVTHILKNN